jgi:hypothetical protein
MTPSIAVSSVVFFMLSVIMLNVVTPDGSTFHGDKLTQSILHEKKIHLSTIRQLTLMIRIAFL